MKTISALLSLCIFFLSPLTAKNLTLSCPHKDVSFQVMLAQTPPELEKGLMFRTHLADNEGMLFLYSPPQPVAMWMKNTPLSLDMIFCRSDGKILAIYENTTPYSLKTIGPVRETAQVLEVLGGTVQTRGITKACVLTLDH